MKIAVIAASGQLGAAVVRATSTVVGADSVVAVCRTPAKAEGLGVEVRGRVAGRPHQSWAEYFAGLPGR